jgi:hypothetical protein
MYAPLACLGWKVVTELVKDVAYLFRGDKVINIKTMGE